jgi:hypothetical protein
MGTNGLAPNQGMFAGSAVNSPLSTSADQGWLSSMSSWMRDNGLLSSYDPKTGLRTEGSAMPILGGIQALGGLYLGLQQYNLAKETLANNKAQFERNFAAQRNTTNANLDARQNLLNSEGRVSTDLMKYKVV